MKSIKEKAHEIGWQFSKHYDPIACKQEWCEMAARAGANYVLDAIIECMPKTHSFNPNETIDIIASMIKQLKK